MYVKIKRTDNNESTFLTVSKLTVVSDLKSLVHEELNVVPSRQRLFYRGKQV